jgi:hypothetical protein
LGKINTFKYHELKTIEETMSIIHLENNHRKTNTLEEIEILKAASSKYLLNDVIAGQNDPMYKLLPSSVILTQRSTAQTKQQRKFRNPTIKIISYLNSNCQLHIQEIKETKRSAGNVALTTRGLQERKHNL